MEQKTEVLVDASEIATLVHLTENVVRKYVRANKIPHRKLGDGKRAPVRFYKSEVQLWIDGASLQPIENGLTVVAN